MRHLLPSVMLAAVAAAGCAHKPTVAQTTPPENPGASAAPATAGQTGPTTATAPQAAKPECGEIRVHFPFDSSTVVPEDRPLLEQAGACLRAEQAMRIVIEGNADERGTVEYNIALGQRRADAVRTYLEQLGVSQEQLKTVSYGKERPLCTEHNEDCWKKNRRAALVPPSKG
ncbi:MAG TPA: peptidoglycan-associated lipoprotein Pal [Haliangiales bacterium]|nr:peptidoglycan-associated lipoprotein Pal [Haliangiales bacterium]